MKKTILFAILSLLALSLQARHIIDLTTGQVSADTLLLSPERDVEYVEDGIVVTYKIRRAALDEDDLYAGTFNIEIPGFTACSSLRMPGLPMGGDFFIVPRDSEPSVSLVSARHRDLKYELAPARWPMSMSDTVSYSKDNVPAIQPYSGFWPQEVLEEQPSGMYRRQPIANAAVNPVSYNYDSRTVRVYTEIKYKISFANSKSMADLEFEPGSLLNPNYSLPTKALKKVGRRVLENGVLQIPGSNVDANAGYLVISVPEFESTLQEFVKWKKRLGYNVTELYDAAWTPEKIKAAVKQQYDNDSTLVYILFVGDHRKIPGVKSKRSSNSNEFMSDLSYGCYDDDSFPDFYRGRIPVFTEDELQVYIDKMLWYEQAPPADLNFYNTSAHFSFFSDGETKNAKHDGIADDNFAWCSEKVRDYMLANLNFNVKRIYSHFIDSRFHEFCFWPLKWSNNKPLPPDLLHENGFNWNYGASDLVDAVNEGVSYVLYRGHGGPEGWGNKQKLIFEPSDVTNMHNGNKLPIVFSITCLSGKNDGDTCVVRSFLTAPNGGAVGVYAATEETYNDWNNHITTLFFNTIWPHPGFKLYDLFDKEMTLPFFSESVKQLGAILDNVVYNIPNGISGIFHRKTYHLFGDPSMYFRTEQPEVLDDYIEITRIEGGRGTRVYLRDGKKAFIAFYDPIDNKVVRKYGDEAAYFTNDIGGSKYVDIVVYTENSVPYMDFGEKYYGVIEDTPNTGTRFLGYQNMGGGVMIDYYMSSSAANQGVEIWIQDVLTGRIESTWPLSGDGVCDQKASIGMRCSTGVKIAYMVVGGMPQPDTMKMYVSR